MSIGSKQILKPIDSEGRFINYTPRIFASEVPLQALPFVRGQGEESNSTFKIDQLIAEQTGLTEIEKQNFQNHLEEEVLKRLSLVQEQAYKEAHTLGMIEGEKKGYTDTTTEVRDSIAQLGAICNVLSEIKTQTMKLISSN
jgi:flagellar biosynthesis/type III secretory pathway protein FliH